MRSVLLLAAAVSLLAAKTPISHESLWLMKRVGAPVPSPDGKWVVFTVTAPAYDEKDQASDLWLVPADGSAKARQITFNKTRESEPSWSPDSRSIVFVARREGDEKPQVYLLELGGGEARRLTTAAMGASTPLISPDGKLLLFSSQAYPDATDEASNNKIAAERKARKYNARVYETFPIRHWDKWLDDMQTHLFVQPLGGGNAKDILAGTKLVAERGFGGVRGSESETMGAVWTPDSQGVVFAATVNRNAGAHANVITHLYLAPAAGGEIRQLTSGTGASYSQPQFRPDAKALYALHQHEGEKIYSLSRLARFDWPSVAKPALIGGSWDRSVSSFAFTPDSRTVYMTAEDAGNEKLYSAPADGGDDVRTVVDLKLGCYARLQIPERGPLTLVAQWESAVNPTELVRIDPQARGHRLLTDFNVAAAAELDILPVQHFWFTSKRGKRIHNMVALPPEFEESKKYPLFVVIHGGPASMWRDQWVYRWNYHLLARPGYVVLLTDYTGSTGYGEKFAQEIQLDPLRGPAEEVNEAADQAIAKFPYVDASRQAAGGASYGGHLANWLQATTTRYKCLISHAGLINLESQWGTSDTIYHRELGSGGPVWEQGTVWREQNPIRYAKNFKTPMLLTIGENDFRVPLNQTLENWSVLQRLQIPSKLVVFPDENHWIQKGENSRFWYSEVHAWLARYLGAGVAGRK